MATANDEMISLREFARRDGCSEKRVRTGVKTGHLPRLDGPKLPAALVGSGWREGNRRGAGADAHKVRTGCGQSASLSALAQERPQQRLLPPEASTLAAMVEGICGDAAILLLRQFPLSVVRPIVSELMASGRHSAVALLEEDGIEPPDGCESWADHPLFADLRPTSEDWREFCAEACLIP